MDLKAKRKELLKMDDHAMVDRILAFPDREKLNREEDGTRRKYPSASMASQAKQRWEKNPDYKLSEKQRFAMAQSFATYSTDELKVAGIKAVKVDPNQLMKEEVSKEGTKTVYDMKFHLEPEPENAYDKNAVAVYVDTRRDNENTPDRVRIGYVPAAYVAVHPITQPMDVNGTLTDHSNGHFKTISYVMNMDTEAVYAANPVQAKEGLYTYRMPFILNGDVKEGAAEYLNTQRDWTKLLNNEFGYWGVNGEVDSVRFAFHGNRSGSVIVSTPQELNQEAVGICGSYFRYGLESGISGDLKRDGYVDCPLNLPAVNTREKTYFSLQAQPEEIPEVKLPDINNEDDFNKAIGLIDDGSKQEL